MAGSFVTFPRKGPRMSSLFWVFAKNAKEISIPSLKILPDYCCLLLYELETQDLKGNTATMK